MTIELVAGRLIARHVGQSLYTWTAIIGIMLAGISFGNYFGGLLADRTRGRGALPWLFAVAAAATLGILPLNAWAGQIEPWAASWPARIFAHTSITFLLPAVVLGMISPVVARRALDADAPAGKTLGAVYAWGMAGSIVGTFLTGYGLVAWLGARAILTTAAGGLASISLAYALLDRHPSSLQSPGEESTPPQAESADGMGWVGFVALVLLANACVMSVELVAGRMVSRQFGQSLYSWTTVIGVILAGMSAGGLLGGFLADRLPVRRLATGLLVGASALCIAAVPLNRLLTQTESLKWFSWPVQIGLHTAGAFFLPALLLGAANPAIIRDALRRGYGAGRTVGLLYACGVAGSLAGTFLSGYWLIAWLGSDRLLMSCALLLGFAALVLANRSPVAWTWAVAGTLVVALALLPTPFASVLAQRLLLRESVAPTTVYARESQYSYIAIEADAKQPNVRQMYLDKLVHSEVDLRNPKDLHYEYEWVYSAIIDLYYPNAQPIKAMIIGGGGYAYPHYLEVARPGSFIEVSEIDPAVTEAAHAAFGLPRNTSMLICTMDARNRVADLIRQRRERSGDATVFDCIFGDSINDYTVPYHLTTIEFVRQAADLLAPDGIYLLNMIDMFDSSRFFGAVVNTCRQVFPNVYAFNTGRPHSVRDTFVVVSSRRPLDLKDIPERIRATYSDYRGKQLSKEDLDQVVARTGAVTLTDDYAPVENLLLPVVKTRQRDHGELFLDEARRLLAQGQFEKAAAECRAALKVHPKWSDANDVLGDALSKKGDTGAAIAAWLDSIHGTLPTPETCLKVAGTLINEKKFAEAVEPLNRACALAPTRPDAYERLGTTLLRLNQTDAALVALEKAIQLDTNRPQAHYNLGLALAAKNRLPEAIAQWRETTILAASHGDAWYNLALAFYMTKDYEDTWKAVEQCKALGTPLDEGFMTKLRQDSGREK